MEATSSICQVRGEPRSSVNGIASSNPLSDATASKLPGRGTDRDRFYMEFAPLVRRLIRQYGQDREMREDLAGEIYCRFCTLYEAFDPTRGVPLRAYMVRQLTLATYSYARQQWRIKNRESAWDLERTRTDETAAFDPTVDWLAALIHDQAATLLPAAIKRLPTRQRNVVIWRYYEERSFEEIADVLGIELSTVRSLLRHGLNNLRKAIHSADFM
jgi:RNA polymerase sigma factor (sigma-70 family)